ncbi:hypothetical protein HYY69_01845 [Candidatus Woesearchaeota archaeon]|nr:hypothetical protein [Candidatus Woesearchaeota archaeon]
MLDDIVTKEEATTYEGVTSLAPLVGYGLFGLIVARPLVQIARFYADHFRRKKQVQRNLPEAVELVEEDPVTAYKTLKDVALINNGDQKEAQRLERLRLYVKGRVENVIRTEIETSLKDDNLLITGTTTIADLSPSYKAIYGDKLLKYKHACLSSGIAEGDFISLEHDAEAKPILIYRKLLETNQGLINIYIKHIIGVPRSRLHRLKRKIEERLQRWIKEEIRANLDRVQINEELSLDDLSETYRAAYRLK